MKTKLFIALFAVVCTTACISRQPVKARGDTSTSPSGVLIYSDQSPGSLPHAEALRMVAESEGQNVTSITDPSEFATQLAATDWSRVHVVARYASAEPSYATALRNFANTYPDKTIQMLFWHDNGTQPTADTAVAATMAIVLWNRGTTTTGYTNIGNPLAGKARTTPGHRFPDFAGIVLTTPAVVAQVPAEQAAGVTPILLIKLVITIILEDNCRHECLKLYNESQAICNANQAIAEQQCQELYGSDEDGPGSPADFEDCIQNANNNHSNCISSAVFNYTNCVALCPPIEEPQPQQP